MSNLINFPSPDNIIHDYNGVTSYSGAFMLGVPVKAPVDVELMTMANILKLLKIGRTKLWEMRKLGEFPQPIIKSPARWRKDAVYNFIGGLS